jgi:phenylalanyl-tRNA synthetase alpha chain
MTTVVKLREYEQKTLLALQKHGGKASVNDIIQASGLAHAAVMRAALSLASKNLVTVTEKKQTIVTLNEEGKYHAKKGLPERRIINSLTALGGQAPLNKVIENSSLEKEYVPIALGWLQRKNWAILEKKQQILKILKKPLPESDEQLLNLLYERKTLTAEDLDEKLREAVSVLKKRKLLELRERTLRELVLTDTGWEHVKKGIEIEEEISQLTPELIITGKWRTTKLRRFDVTAPGPIIYPGKTHPLQQIIQKTREIFLEMGFTEIRGPIVETAFWNFDALFQPQDHPAREMMDTFYLAYPKEGKLPEKSVVNAVAKTHEDGWVTGSTGWKYKWDAKEAKKLLLRTHTTAVTIQYLSKHKKPPIKIFSVDRVYRNERVDYKHIPEFHQIEGIVMDKNVTLRDLMGTLSEFYHKLGIKNIQFWPSYFPYTEPSVEATVYIPKIKAWIELGGMGMFRPEVLAPFGIKYPVLAWGVGIERLALVELGIDDIRFPYKNDLGWLRRTPLCLR